MKLKTTIVTTITIFIAGCTTINSNKKLPKCDGKYTHALNKDKWDWNNKGAVLRENIKKPVSTPIILNMLENEKQGTNEVVNMTSLSYKDLSYKNCGGQA
ncbi:type IV secretion system protein VirB7 [Bartonella sp. CB178]|uniref:type IV secretion system protein VirB7 n=1 Tax=Bartonella sp. CB178 TaxID=3112255 RepID=UPI00300DD50E